MNVFTKNVGSAASSPWFIVLSGLASIVGAIAYFYDKINGRPFFLTVSVFIFLLAVLIFGCIYSVVVRTENAALRSLTEVFYEINQIYRDKLRELFASDNPVSDPDDLLAKEEQVLRSVCQRIENIFSRVISRNCMVTIKLVTKENGKCFAHSYVRSQELCVRDKPERVKFSVGTGENTAFDKALEIRSDGLPSHFHSPNLDVEMDKYSNKRTNFRKYYRSAIVVPIRGVNKGKEATPEEFDLIGFLCVDTLSVNRLNNGYHLYMLSALSSQMYNFMSMMRGKYTVFVG